MHMQNQLRSPSGQLNTETEIKYLFALPFAANCYTRIMGETKEMQEKIAEKLGLNPVESEVVVLYDGERDKVRI